MDGKFTARTDWNGAPVIFDPSGNRLSLEDVVEKLNKLHLENKKLKKEVADWKEECLYLEANR